MMAAGFRGVDAAAQLKVSLGLHALGERVVSAASTPPLDLRGVGRRTWHGNFALIEVGADTEPRPGFVGS